jgi:regulatory protein
MLGRRENTRAQLRRKLQQRKYETADIDRVLDELGAAGFLDDARAAKSFARHASHIKGQGRLLTSAEYHQMAGRAGRPQFDDRVLSAKGGDADLGAATLDAQIDP